MEGKAKGSTSTQAILTGIGDLKTEADMILVWVVVATPKSSSTVYNDLQPRTQCWNDGMIAIYETEDQAKEWVEQCNTDRGGFTYKAELRAFRKIDIDVKCRYSSKTHDEHLRSFLELIQDQSSKQ